MQPNDASLPGPVDTNARVRAALSRTAEVLTGHWTRLLASRTPGLSAAGSVCDAQEGGIESALHAATWEPYSHPSVMAGCTAFWTRDIVGTFGLCEIDLLPESTNLTLRDAHNAGFVEAEVVGVRGEKTEGTCLIVGDSDGAEVVFTFHPGVPVPPSRIPAAGNDGRVVSPSEAMARGLSRAKIVTR